MSIYFKQGNVVSNLVLYCNMVHGHRPNFNDQIRIMTSDANERNNLQHIIDPNTLTMS